MATKRNSLNQRDCSFPYDANNNRLTASTMAADPHFQPAMGYDGSAAALEGAIRDRFLDLENGMQII